MIEEKSGITIPDELEATLRPVSRMVPAPWNPNVQNDKVFNSLVENIQTVGFVEPIVLAPLDDDEMRGKYLSDAQQAEGGEYWLIVGGKHRWDAGQVLDMERAPSVLMHGFLEDQVKFQNMRLNMLKGKIDPEKFTKLYMEMADQYGEDIVKDQMALLDEKQFGKMLQSVKDNLPPELAKKVEEAKGEMRTVDDLSRVLNELFTKYGSTLEISFMLFSFGGKTHVWVQMDADMKKRADWLTSFCYDNQIDINDAFRELLSDAEDRLPAAGLAQESGVDFS